jgi:hypothetical protein
MTRTQKRKKKARPHLNISKEELEALINFNFGMADHFAKKYDKPGSREQKDHYHKRGKELVTLRQNYPWTRL